jgi:hypothetical protein
LTIAHVLPLCGPTVAVSISRGPHYALLRRDVLLTLDDDSDTDLINCDRFAFSDKRLDLSLLIPTIRAGRTFGDVQCFHGGTPCASGGLTPMGYRRLPRTAARTFPSCPKKLFQNQCRLAEFVNTHQGVGQIVERLKMLSHLLIAKLQSPVVAEPCECSLEDGTESPQATTMLPLLSGQESTDAQLPAFFSVCRTAVRPISHPKLRVTPWSTARFCHGPQVAKQTSEYLGTRHVGGPGTHEQGRQFVIRGQMKLTALFRPIRGIGAGVSPQKLAGHYRYPRHRSSDQCVHVGRVNAEVCHAGEAKPQVASSRVDVAK